MGAHSEGRPAWAPRSWEVEELDVDPSELARRIRAHEGEGLIDLYAPAPDVAPEGPAETWASARARDVGEQLVVGGEDLRGLESKLRASGLEALASVLGRASDAVERVGRSLQEGEADRWVAQVRGLVGEESWRTVTGLAAGLLDSLLSPARGRSPEA